MDTELEFDAVVKHALEDLIDLIPAGVCNREPFLDRLIDIKKRLIAAHEEALDDAADEQYDAEQEAEERRAELESLRDYLRKMDALPNISESLRALRVAGEVPWL